MRFLVTGGAGFIGAYTIKSLLNKGYSVISFDNNSDLKLVRKVLSEREYERVLFIQGDISKYAEVSQLFLKHKIDRIIHLAFLLVPDSNQKPLLAIKVNCEGFAHLLEMTRKHGTKRIVFVSSVGVFGPQEKYPVIPIPNDAPHFPQSMYGACKSLNEYLANHYHHQYGLEIIGLRFSIVYGAFREHGQSSFVFRELIEKPTNHKKSKVPYGDDVIDWLYIKDAVRAILYASIKPITKTRVFNVAGTLRPIQDAVKFIKNIYPSSKIVIKRGKIGIVWEFDSQKIRKELGFKPEFSLEQGLIDSLNIYRKSVGMDPISAKRR